MDLMSLLIFLILVGVMFWAVRALSGAFGIPAPVVTVVQVVMVVMVVMYILHAVGGAPLLHIRL